jgi:hypothetical protein
MKRVSSGHYRDKIGNIVYDVRRCPPPLQTHWEYVLRISGVEIISGSYESKWEANRAAWRDVAYRNANSPTAHNTFDTIETLFKAEIEHPRHAGLAGAIDGKYTGNLKQVLAIIVAARAGAEKAAQKRAA